MRIAAVAALACVASWIGLAIGAGNVGLQRSVAVSPLTLLEVPLGLGLASITAFGATWLPSRLAGSRVASPIGVLAGVIAGDVLGAVVLAPILIGELEVIHAPVLFAAITALGLQPAAAYLGAVLSGSRDTRRTIATDDRVH
jgi:hypothetical protein